MTNRFYYRDPSYGDWIIIPKGKNPVREFTYFTEEKYLLSSTSMTKRDRIPPPPKSSYSLWWNGKYWREEPARTMAWDREGIHAGKGLLNGSPVALALVLGFIPGIWVAMALSALFFGRFAIYELSEDSDIRDRPYRDFAGEMVAFMAVVLPCLIYWILRYHN